MTPSFSTFRLSRALPRVLTVRLSSSDEINERFLKVPKRYRGLTHSVWTDFSALVAKYNPIHLDQEIPEFMPDDFVLENLKKAAESEDFMVHQYARGYGHMRLVSALAKLYSKALGREIIPEEEVVISPGAYGSVLSIINAFVDEGDEVILIEPCFESYRGFVKISKGRPRSVPLRLSEEWGSYEPIKVCDFVIDPDELKKAFNKKTKILILNNPHNPTGKVFSRNEIEEIGKLCEKWNVLILADEVYEWMVYPGKEFTKAASIPGLWDRTITVGSCGKSFLATGWKTGWLFGPRCLVKHIGDIQAHTVNSFVTPIQEALAMNIEREIEVWDSEEASRVVSAKRARKMSMFMGKSLLMLGFRPVVPDAGQYVMAEWTDLGSRIKGWKDYPTEGNKDFKFTKWLVENYKVLALPVSAFHHDFKELGEKFIRMNVMKSEEYIEKGIEALRAAASSAEHCV